MRFKLGDDATEKWLQGIADNDAFTFANNAAIVAAVGRGEIEVGLVNHYYVYQALAEDPEFAGVNHDFAVDDIGSLVIVTGASMLESADSQDEAGRADPLPAAGGGAAILLGSDVRVSAGGRRRAGRGPARDRARRIGGHRARQARRRPAVDAGDDP